MCEVHNQVTQAYQDYKFNQVYRTLYDYVVTELSQGYLNATKDRVYCGATTGLERRSALTTWSYLLAMLVRDLQPILVFTCDEVLEHMPQSLREGKTFAALLSWFSAPVDEKHMATYLPAYKALVQIRNSFTKAYERAREDTSFDENTTQATLARISLTPEMKKALEVVPHLDVAEALVCSAVELSDGEDLSCSVVQATGSKCPRCWNWRHLESDGLCSRCSEVMGNL
nr:class I tRNA ligase family protein [Fannyhessea vaginae]